MRNKRILFKRKRRRMIRSSIWRRKKMKVKNKIRTK
jgi:hypothetical protein